MDNGEPLRLAIPLLASYGHIPSQREAVLESLGIDVGDSIVSNIATVFCSLLNRGGGGPDSLQSYMGEIIDTQRIDLTPCYAIPVIVIEINGKGSATRWPAGPVILEGDD